MTGFKRKALFIIISALILLCGCAGKGGGGQDGGEETSAAEDISFAEDNGEVSEPFSSYAFKLTGETENYMVFLRRGDEPDKISVTVENNRYESRDFVITAPAGYLPQIPASKDDAPDIVKLITNDIDDEPVPDIMQFNFSSADSSENSSGEVCRMFIIDENGELEEVKFVSYRENDEGRMVKHTAGYLDRTQLYHSEPKKFIYEISVDDTNIYDDNGEPRPIGSRVRIRTLTLNPSVPCLVEGYEDISEENILYFGYACWAAANSAAQNFTVTTFNISDWDNYVEKPDSEDGDASDYYFRIDDPRFENTRDLKLYLRSVFTPAEADRIFNEAPQRYTDIDGKLYGIAGDARYDLSLGTLTFSGYTADESRMVFFSRQEKFDEKGDFTGYTDGGNFIIVRGPDDNWKVSSYRYPYSFN